MSGSDLCVRAKLKLIWAGDDQAQLTQFSRDSGKLGQLVLLILLPPRLPPIPPPNSYMFPLLI